MSRYKWGNVVLIMLSLILSVVLAEIVCRLVLPQPGYVPRGIGEPVGMLEEHATRGFAYVKNFVGVMKTDEFSTLIRINARGFREIPVSPTSDGLLTKRILAVGDSMTFGWGVEAEESWPARLQSYLNAETNTHQVVQVTNDGVSAYSLAQIAILTKEVMAQQETDMVILGLLPAVFGRIEDPYVLFNGLKVKQSSVPFLKPFGDGFLSTSMRRPLLQAIDFWLDEHLWFGAHAVQLAYKAWSMPRWAYLMESKGGVQIRTEDHDTSRFQALLQELESIAKFVESRQRSFVVLLMVTQDKDGRINEAQRRYNQSVLEFCKEKHIAVVDLLPVLVRKSEGRPIFRFPKDAHWTVPAHDIAAKELARFIRQNQSIAGLY